MLREDIFGTIIVLIFDIIVTFMLSVIFRTESIMIVNIACIALSVVAIWATVKICIYWFNKIKAKWNLKRKQ